MVQGSIITGDEVMQPIKLYFPILALLLIYSNAVSSTCGILKLQSSRSFASEISHNACGEPDNLSVGTRIKLNPNSRVWLNSIHSVAESSKYKIICQNQSTLPVELKLDSAFIPWLRPEGRLTCSEWVEQRLECKKQGSAKATLICAIAKNNTVEITHVVLKSTSITLRGGSSKKAFNTSDEQNGSVSTKLKKELNPKLALCEKLFEHETAMDWTINPNGKVTRISLKNKAEDKFTRCVIRAIKAHNFPVSPTAIRVSTAYK